MKHNLTASYRNVRIRPLCENDLELLRVWRNDSNLTTYLADIGTITPQMQYAWYERDNADENCYTFAIEEICELKRCVGSVAIYNFKDSSAVFGRFLIGDKETKGKGIGFIAAVLCLYLGFEELGLETITSNIHEDNIASLKTTLKSGFAVSGKRQNDDGINEVNIAVERDYFYKAHDFLDKIELE